MRRLFYLPLLALFGCAVQTHSAEPEHDELALYMYDMQRYSQKFGYALEEKNWPLLRFYLEEMEEVLHSLEGIESHDEMPIAEPVEIIMLPLHKELVDAVRSENKKAARKSYEKFVDGCNRCHNATEHEFIRILPTKKGPGPYNQDFSLQR